MHYLKMMGFYVYFAIKAIVDLFVDDEPKSTQPNKPKKNESYEETFNSHFIEDPHHPGWISGTHD